VQRWRPRDEGVDESADVRGEMQNSGLASTAAAQRVIELAEQVPPPSIAPVGADADEILRFVREKSDTELDTLRLQLAGLGEGNAAAQGSTSRRQS
jgi:hypothetical protein